jgi:uncharacterized protein YcbK (DUF882 family)
MDIVKDDEWGLYPHFTRDEMKCKHTGFCEMTHAMMSVLERIRTEYGKPMIISSGYRDISHPVERNKPHPGEHTFGMAADILVHGSDAQSLLYWAVMTGIKRIGVNQKGEMGQRYLHLGIGDRDNGRFPVAVWSY